MAFTNTLSVFENVDGGDYRRYLWLVTGTGAEEYLPFDRQDSGTVVIDTNKDRLWHIFIHCHDGVTSGAWGSLNVQLYGSHDDTNYVAIGSAFTADNDPGYFIDEARFRYIKLSVTNAGTACKVQVALHLEKVR